VPIPKKCKEPVFLFNGFLLAAFVLMYHQTGRFSERAQKFPKFVLGIGILTLTFWMVSYIIFPAILRFTEQQAEKEDERTENRARYYWSWFCIAVSILTGYLFGFVFVVPAAFLSYGLILGERGKWLSLMIVMLAMTFGFYIVFYRILHIPVLRGVILNVE